MTTTPSRAGLDKSPHEVAAMFDAVAAKYDTTNTVLSGGLDKYWRRRTRRLIDPHPGERVLDLAAGTGVSSIELARSGATVVGSDFSTGMLFAGRVKSRAAGVPLVAGDALALPFADATFDAVTISFGLRNVHDVGLALRELLRVSKPGGRLVVCEFSRPVLPVFSTVYTEYLMRALPAIARKVSSNGDAYAYLAESIRAWPDQRRLADKIMAAGWTGVAWHNLTGGAVALHHAVRP